jgi:hypothetical protein
MMGYTNHMEVIALTTAVADARAAIQATTRDIKNWQALHLPDRRRDGGVSAMLRECNDMLSVIQVHLSYLVQNDSLLLVPGTNAEHSGTFTPPHLRNTVLTFRVTSGGLLGGGKVVRGDFGKSSTTGNDGYV